MTSKTKLTQPHLRAKLARSGAISGPGFTSCPFLGISVTAKRPAERDRHINVFSTWLPRGRTFANLVPEYDMWFPEIGWYETAFWANLLGITQTEWIKRFQQVLRGQKREPALNDLLTAEDVRTLAPRLSFTTRQSIHGDREINIWLAVG